MGHGSESRAEVHERLGTQRSSEATNGPRRARIAQEQRHAIGRGRTQYECRREQQGKRQYGGEAHPDEDEAEGRKDAVEREPPGLHATGAADRDGDG